MIPGLDAPVPADLAPRSLANLTAIVAQDYHYLFDVAETSDALTYVSRNIWRDGEANGSQC